VLPMDQWNELAERLKSKGVKFIIEPKVRFKGEVGEQATMFFLDPSGNALEFKSFKDFSLVFAKQLSLAKDGRKIRRLRPPCLRAGFCMSSFMKAFLFVWVCFLTFSVSAQSQRTIAITIDDLPVVSTRKDLKNRQEITQKIIGHIKKAKVPV